MDQGVVELFRAGDVIAGRYRVERVIGQGGMGVVLAVEHVQLEQRFAMKFLLGHGASDAVQSARFFREARAAAQIKSEHVTRVFDTGTLESGAPYIVMECLEGHDLASEIGEKGRLAVEEAVDYVLQGCEAVAEAHSLGIVHRDLKPANLFLSRRGDGSICVKVLDFGISKIVSQASPEPALTATTAVMGSPLYMSPEQVRSSKQVDARTDIWSIGVILYEALTGTTPFAAETLSAVLARIVADPPTPLSEVRPDVPQALETTIMACLEKDPARRVPNLTVLAERLAPFASASARLSVERVLRLGLKSGDSAPPGPTATPVPRGTENPQTSAAWGQTGHGSAPSGQKGLVLGLAAAFVVAAGSGAWLWHASTKDQAATLASSPVSAEPPASVTPPSLPAPVPEASVSASASASAVASSASSAAAPPAAPSSTAVDAGKTAKGSSTSKPGGKRAAGASTSSPADAGRPPGNATVKPDFGGRL